MVKNNNYNAIQQNNDDAIEVITDNSKNTSAPASSSSSTSRSPSSSYRITQFVIGTSLILFIVGTYGIIGGYLSFTSTRNMFRGGGEGAGGEENSMIESSSKQQP